MSEAGVGGPVNLPSPVADAIARHWKLFLFEGLALMVLGLLAAALPQVTTLAIEILVGALLVAGGGLRLIALLRARRTPGHVWSLLMAALAIGLGLVLLAKPLAGVLTLTIVLIALFLVEGIGSIFIALDQRRHLSNWGWVLLSGLVDLALAALIWAGWPASAAWALGLLFGINLFFLGLSLTMMALAARTLAQPDTTDRRLPNG